jgi:hypothetical protein
MQSYVIWCVIYDFYSTAHAIINLLQTKLIKINPINYKKKFENKCGSSYLSRRRNIIQSH